MMDAAIFAIIGIAQIGGVLMFHAEVLKAKRQLAEFRAMAHPAPYALFLGWTFCEAMMLLFGVTGIGCIIASAYFLTKWMAT